MKVRRWPRRWPHGSPCVESLPARSEVLTLRLRFREYCRHYMGAASCGPSSSASPPVSVSQIHLVPPRKYQHNTLTSHKFAVNLRHVLAGYDHPTIASSPAGGAGVGRRNSVRFASTNLRGKSTGDPPKEEGTAAASEQRAATASDDADARDGPAPDDAKTFRRKKSERQAGVQSRHERPSWWRRMYSYITWNISQYPVVVAICSSGCLIGAGDATSQFILEDGKIDFYRVVARCSGSMLLYGAVLARFYRWLSGIDRFFPTRFVKFALPLKVGLDVLFVTPFFFLPFFYVWMGYFYDHMGWRDSLTRYWTNVARDTLAACVVYVPGQLLNFYAVPLTYRIVAMNIQDFSYAVGFAYLNGRTASQDDLPRFPRKHISENDFPDVGLAFQEEDELRIHRRLTTETIARVHNAYGRRKTTHHIPQPIAQERPPPVPPPPQVAEANVGLEPADAAEISVPVVLEPGQQVEQGQAVIMEEVVMYKEGEPVLREVPTVVAIEDLEEGQAVVYEKSLPADQTVQHTPNPSILSPAMEQAVKNRKPARHEKTKPVVQD